MEGERSELEKFAFGKLRLLIEAEGGIMHYTQKVKGAIGGAWIICFKGRIGVFTNPKGQFLFQELEALYDIDELRTDALDRLLSRLEEIKRLNP